MTREKISNTWSYWALATAAVAFTAVVAMAPRAARAQSCTGDCNNSGDVTVNELIILVNIATGAAQVSACPNGLPAGTSAVTVPLIIQGVNNLLNSTCATGTPGTSTPTPEVSPTPTTGIAAVCGNGAVDAGEDCDDGGTCLGGSNAGTHCTAEADCSGNGVCVGGVNQEHACGSDGDCPGSACKHCIPQGGDGCAANCTNETQVTFHLQTGVFNGTTLESGSGSIVNSSVLTLPLPLSGTQTLTIGKENADGTIPVVVKAASVNFPEIAVGALACACVRGVPAKTCGGVLFNADGTPTANCTTGFASPVETCPDTAPCAFVHGDGNSATGIIACNAGLQGVNLSFTQDNINGDNMSPPMIVLSGTGDAGSAIILNSTAIGQVTGTCASHPGFCTDADDPSIKGVVATLPIVTGTAQSQVTNANGIEGSNVPPDAPAMLSGQTFNCATLLSTGASGGALAGSFTSLGQPPLNDIAVVDVLKAQ